MVRIEEYREREFSYSIFPSCLSYYPAICPNLDLEIVGDAGQKKVALRFRHDRWQQIFVSVGFRLFIEYTKVVILL